MAQYAPKRAQYVGYYQISNGIKKKQTNQVNISYLNFRKSYYYSGEKIIMGIMLFHNALSPPKK
jgi:hypothetical protein